MVIDCTGHKGTDCTVNCWESSAVVVIHCVYQDNPITKSLPQVLYVCIPLTALQPLRYTENCVAVCEYLWAELVATTIH